MGANRLRGEGACGEPASGNLRRQALRSAGDFLSAAVIESDHQNELVIVARRFSGLFRRTRDFRSEALGLAVHADADAVLVQLARSLRMKRRNNPIRSRISAAGRDQFSELNEKVVRMPMPRSPA